MTIFVNTRSLSANLTGVQRYIKELTTRFQNRVQAVRPRNPLHGVSGHVWEQVVLPTKIGDSMLWSPGNTGPLAIKKQVVTILDVSPLDHPEWMSLRFASWYRFLTPKLIRQARAILTISEFSKERIINYCPGAASKIHVVHLGADERFCPVDEVSIRLMRARLAIPSPYYIVALGSLEPRKNLQRLLQAWASIQARIPDDVWLVLAGAQGKKMIFGDISFETLPPRVHLTGHVQDDLLPALYSGAIASPYLSLYEGFGLPPLEAMACGTPVLASNVTSLPEVVGDAAVTVDPYDVEAIGEALARVIDDSQLLSDLRDRGLERAKQFSWDKAADETWQILQWAARL